MYQVAALWLPCCFQCWYEHFSFFFDYLITENPVSIDAAVYTFLVSTYREIHHCTWPELGTSDLRTQVANL